MEEERKKLHFVFIFLTYLPVFLLKFRSGELVGCGIWFCIQRVPTLHTFDGPRYPKNKKYLKKMWWWHHHHVFLGISYFWGSRVRQKYAVWVLIESIIKFHIQRDLPLIIWVKTQGDMSKIQTKKLVFFYDKYVNSTIMVDSFYWNSIGSWIPTHKIYCNSREVSLFLLPPTCTRMSCGRDRVEYVLFSVDLFECSEAPSI